MFDTKKFRLALPITVIAFATLLAGCSSEGEETAAIGECAAAKEIAVKIAPLAVGDVAAFSVIDEPKKLPDLTFLDRDGKQVSTSDFEGKTVLFNLWATWCAPCREEMPYFDTLEADFGGEDFGMLPVSVDRGEAEKPLAFYDEIGISKLPFYQDPTMGVFNILRKQSLALGLPVTMLLDEEGCLLGTLNGPAAWAGEDAKKLIRAAMGERVGG